MLKRLPRWVAVSLGFAAFIGAGLLVALVLAPKGTLAERCIEHCAGQGKQGQMVPRFPSNMTGGRPVQENCECR